MKIFPPQGMPASAAACWEQLIDLYAPLVEQPDGSWERDTDAGVISREDFMRLLETPLGTHPNSEDPTR